MNMKKYVDIERVKESYALDFEIGEHIVIEEKIDSANSSFRYDETNNCLTAFSRRKKLNEDNTLNGFWNWVQSLNVEKNKRDNWESLYCFWRVDWGKTFHYLSR